MITKRRERLSSLIEYLDGRGKVKGSELRKFYDSPWKLDGDLTLLDSTEIIGRNGCVAFGNGTAVLERRVSLKDLEELFPRKERVGVCEE